MRSRMSSRDSMSIRVCLRAVASSTPSTPSMHESNLERSSSSLNGSAADPRGCSTVRSSMRPSRSRIVTFSCSAVSDSASIRILGNSARTSFSAMAVGVKSATRTAPRCKATARQNSMLKRASSSSSGFGNFNNSMFLAGMRAMTSATSLGARPCSARSDNTPSIAEVV